MTIDPILLCTIHVPILKGHYHRGRLYNWATILQILTKVPHTTLWLLDDLWPHPPMHHPCSYTQGSLPPSLIKIDGRLYKWAAILQTLTKMSHMTLWPLDDLWPQPPMHHPCSYIQGSLPPSLIKIDWRLYKWAAILQTLTKMSHTTLWPLDDLWPHPMHQPCSYTQGSLPPSLIKIDGRLYKWAAILQTLTKISHTTLWPLDDLWPHPPMHQPCSYTQGSLPPSLIKIDERLYKWAAILQTLTKMSHTTLWPLDDLWPHPPMHHLCSCTQGSLPPSLMKIDGRLYKWAAILQTLTKTSHTYVHTYTQK